MARPGVQVASRDAAPSRSLPTDTGQWFVIGIAEQGPTNVAVKVTSLQSYVTTFGARTSRSATLYDSLDTYFQEGGAVAYVVRIVGSAAVAAYHEFSNGSGVSLRLTAKSQGTWGNAIKAGILAGDAGGNFKVVVKDAADVVLETSPDLADKAAAIEWSTGSLYVVATDVDVAKGDPSPTSAVLLTSGADDLPPATAQYTAGLSLFPRSLGPGQVSIPGQYGATIYAAINAHCPANNRVGVLGTTDTGTVGTLVGDGVLARAAGNTSYSALFAPRGRIPGIINGTYRTVPYVAAQAGLEARRDAQTSQNIPAAGQQYPLRYVFDLAYTFSDADREQLLLAGVNTARNVNGTLETYGYRTVADGSLYPNWVQFNYARLRMALLAQFESIGEGFVFAQIDGSGAKLGELQAALSGVCQDYYVKGSLYGASPSDAFVVDVGPSVNTTTTISNGEIHAVVNARFSPHGELVVIELVKTPISQSV